jgi:plasmid stabilization system protein ParE
MNRRVRFRPEAEAEIGEAVDWYEARSPGLGAEFLRSLDGAVAGVEREPLSHAVVYASARRAVLRRFPYSLIYEISRDEILIVACIHGRRDPKRWQERTS